VKEVDWDDETQSVKPTCTKYRNLTRVNNHLHSTLLTAGDTITKLQSSGLINGMSVNDVRERLDNNSTSTSFVTFTEDIIKDMKQAHKLGNAAVYQQALDFLKRVTNRTNLSFEEINYELLKSIETKYESATNSLNGLSVYLRTIRAIYNRAIHQNVASLENYPFRHYCKIR
jgi:hypothetical protein